jgi:hypothetical protein
MRNLEDSDSAAVFAKFQHSIKSRPATRRPMHGREILENVVNLIHSK